MTRAGFVANAVRVRYTLRVRIAIDFDDTIVRRKTPYTNTNGQFEFMPGAKEGLQALKAAGHELLLYSARASLSKRVDWRLNPLAKARPEPNISAAKYYATNEARFCEMVEFVERELPGVFDAIDEGGDGKPAVDLFIDDRGQRYGGTGLSWDGIVRLYGDS